MPGPVPTSPSTQHFFGARHSVYANITVYVNILSRAAARVSRVGFWAGRLDNAWRERDDVVKGCAAPPSTYLTRFSVDTVVFEERSLRLLIDAHGIDRIMVGSDYPYPLGERPVGTVVDGATFLTEDERNLLWGGNALRFLNRSE